MVYLFGSVLRKLNGNFNLTPTVVTIGISDYSCVYTRVLTRVQLTSCRELSSNPPIDVVESIRVIVWVGGVHTGGESGLEPSCKRGLPSGI